MQSPACLLCCCRDTSHLHRDKRRDYYRCHQCGLTFVPAADHVSLTLEKHRYDQHQNNPNDEGYRNFLARILPPLLPRITPESHGLDFGCGPSPALAMMLVEKGYQADFYDPYYHNDNKLLQHKYDYITCTEVVEHFRNPEEDWQGLIQLLKKGGWLAVMTQTLPEDEDFSKWYYIRDETHVCFYTETTFRWIADKHGLRIKPPQNTIILFQK